MPRRNRYKCAVCLREISVNDLRELLPHNRRKSYRKGQERDRCPGSGQQPLDQSRLPV